MPRKSLPAEENCRLLSIYMRPWTLDAQFATKDVPLLTDLRGSLDGDTEGRRTYAIAWKKYINGNVVTEI